MPKEKPESQEAIRSSVLEEYNRRCSVCGRDRPQLHHIDENNKNNTKYNLLPLCPNHHLSDQHNPTQKINIAKLKLFRRYKDPLILYPQFDPLFNRMNFILDLIESDMTEDGSWRNYNNMQDSFNDFVEFLRYLNLGQYYSTTISSHLNAAMRHFLNAASPDYSYDGWQAEHDLAIKRLTQVVSLTIEQLRFQDWKKAKTSPNS